MMFSLVILETEPLSSWLLPRPSSSSWMPVCAQSVLPKLTTAFAAETCPRVFFAGNQKDFEHKVVKGPAGQKCLVVSLAEFAKKGSAALVNLRTLECNEMVFDVKGITDHKDDEGMQE